jgi:hypothetical protein
MLPRSLSDEEKLQTRLALRFHPVSEAPKIDREQRRIDLAQRHDEIMAMLAAEEEAYMRMADRAATAILLQKEYAKMNTELEPVPPPQANLLAVITTAARDPGTNAEKMQQLLDMAERMMKFQAERQFSNAMRLCQEQIGPIAKDAENSHTGSVYAKLESIDAAIRPVYTANGFVMSFSSAPARQENAVRVTCDVRHSSGHTVQYELEGALDTSGPKGTTTKTPLHGLGSTLSHLKRWLTLMIWNVSLTDPRAYVTKEQAAKIREMLDASGVLEDAGRMTRFLQFAQAASVENISPTRYNTVMKTLSKAAELHARNGHP